MGLHDMVDKVKELAGSQAEAVEGAVGQAAEVVKDETPDAVDSGVDQAAEALKDQT